MLITRCPEEEVHPFKTLYLTKSGHLNSIFGGSRTREGTEIICDPLYSRLHSSVVSAIWHAPQVSSKSNLQMV